MIYLDNAATSYPKPHALHAMLDDYLKRLAGNPGRSGHRLSLAAAEEVFLTRSAVADFIGCKNPENIIFTQNATFAINTILRARVKPGSHILISDMEHNAVFRPVWRMAKDKQITYSVFPHSGDICEHIRALITPKTRMLICTHISNTTGFEFPVSDIARICQKHGIYMILDASQSIGHKAVDVNVIGCDALCAPGHKGLLGLQGSGFLYVKDKNGLREVFQGGSGAHSLSPDMPDYLPDRFEAGTLSTPAILSMKIGLNYINGRGLDEIEAHEIRLSHILHSHLAASPHIKLYSRPNSGIVSFRIEGQDSEDTATALDRYGICVRGGYHCAPLAHSSLGTIGCGLVRASIGAFNSPEEMETAAYYIEQTAKNKA